MNDLRHPVGLPTHILTSLPHNAPGILNAKFLFVPKVWNFYVEACSYIHITYNICETRIF